jgi:hypothetical protein
MINNPTDYCGCIHTIINKELIRSDKISNKMRIAQINRFYKGGKLRYSGQPININYLGRTEGMPGGSGSPPTNF